MKFANLVIPFACPTLPVISGKLLLPMEEAV